MKKILVLIAIAIPFGMQAQVVDSAQRKVNIAGGINFRDIGGYATKDGKHVKWGKVYRSAVLDKLTPADMDTLEQRHIKYDLDFRGPYEVAAAPDRIPASIIRISLPAGSENIGDSNQMKQMYRMAMKDSFLLAFYGNLEPFQKRYAPMFQALLKLPKDSALLFHCTAGKDRTGIAAALILYALGVDETTIMADYTATNHYRQAENTKAIAGMVKYGMSEQAAKQMMLAKPEYLQATFASIRKQYGTVEAYLEKEMGLDKKAMKQLRKAYLD